MSSAILQDESSACSTSSVSRDSTKTSPDYKQEEILDGSSVSDEKPVEESLADQLVSRDPCSSQGPLLASSQRVVKNGQIIIRNSDDDGSDSDSSLGDIDDLLRSKKKLDPAVSSPLTELGSSAPSSTERSSPDLICTTRSWTRGEHTMRRRFPVPHPPKYRFDLGTLVKRSVKDETAEACMSKARKTLESIEQRGASRQSEVPLDLLGNSDLDAALVNSALKGRAESSDVEKILMAIHRTEASQREKSWSFFKDGEENVPYDQAIFPTAHLGHCPFLLQGPYL